MHAAMVATLDADVLDDMFQFLNSTTLKRAMFLPSSNFDKV